MVKITTELLSAIRSAPVLESKKLYVFQVLEDIFKKIDLTITFTKKLPIFYDEIIPVEILVHLHRWLRTKCCNIENITLMTSHHIGIQHWWYNWCELNAEKSFEIIEGRPADAYYSKDYSVDRLPDTEFFLSQKNIQLFFSFYGGSYASVERCYLTLRMLELHKCGFIDFLGDFLPKEKILSYAEHITYYTDQLQITALENLYDQFIVDFKLQNNSLLSVDTNKKIPYEPIYGDFQWNIDRHCFATVIRETLIDQPYACLTEKTLRTFLHHLIAIPTGYQAVADLESLGFWFPHDIMDYSYQTKKLYNERISLMIQAIKNITKKMSIDEFTQYYYKNINKFTVNAQLAHKLLMEPIL